MKNEKTLEKEIQDKRLNAPRLTPDDIDAVIESRKFHRFDGTTLTVCCLTLQNGMHVVGESACVSPENFDADIGMKIAYDDARRKIWALEGYLMRERISLSEDGNPFPPIKCAQDAEVAHERSNRHRVTITGNWKDLLQQLEEIRSLQEMLGTKENDVRKCGRQHITLPPEILDDINRTLTTLEESGVSGEITLVMGSGEYHVVGTDENSVIVEAV